MTTTDMEHLNHDGAAVRHLREAQNLKQAGFAELLGPDWNQQKVSLLESKQVIDPPVLEMVAKALKVPPDAIKNFKMDTPHINYYSPQFHDHSVASPYNCTFNPIDKIVQLYEEKELLLREWLKEKQDLIDKLEQKQK